MSEKHEESIAEKEHVCTVCGKPSDTIICHACSDKVRGEAVEKKRDIDKK